LAQEAEIAKREKAIAERALADSGVQIAALFTSLKVVASDLASNKASEKVGKPLLEMLNQADNDLETLKKALASWYDSAMDRVSGWYKYHTQKWLLGIGLVLAVALNADTVRIVTQLSKDSTLRQSIVTAAQQSFPAAKAGAAPSDAPARPSSGAQTLLAKPSTDAPDLEKNFKNVEQQIEGLHQLGIPLGWAGEAQHGLTWPPPWTETDKLEGWLGLWLAKFFGLLITAVAISMGAPFWFDLLNKFMVIRSTVKPQEKSKEEGSKDKATAAPAVG
jgi:hypothetical protein